MAHVDEVFISPQSLARFRPVIGGDQLNQVQREVAETARRMQGRVWWNINSTARGGGVAEMLQSLLAYPLGAGIDTRWLVINGSPEFFHFSKRLHHAIHGEAGDGSPLGDAEREIYERVLEENVQDLIHLVQAGDVVFLHDPQTAGLAPALARAGASVIWQSHIGTDETNDETELAWSFLMPYLTHVEAAIFTRQAYVPPGFNQGLISINPPSIDPFSAKNQELDDTTVRAILAHTGLIEDSPGDGEPVFKRADGSQGRISRRADVIRNGPAPKWDTPLVVQVSRWDPLKDPVGVINGFVDPDELPDEAELVLTGPNVTSVTDDPEGGETFDDVFKEWRQLPQADRGRVHLISLSMDDIEENGAIVNALQRHATVIVQKSLKEGFGLTVAEAMWKRRPVVASRIGGIQDQIEDGVHGLLIDDPSDEEAFHAALRRLLTDPDFAAQLGANAHERVRDEFLAVRQLRQYGELLTRLDVGVAA
jgi:trehalose synthase